MHTAALNLFRGSPFNRAVCVDIVSSLSPSTITLISSSQLRISTRFTGTQKRHARMVQCVYGLFLLLPLISISATIWKFNFRICSAKKCCWMYFRFFATRSEGPNMSIWWKRHTSFATGNFDGTQWALLFVFDSILFSSNSVATLTGSSTAGADIENTRVLQYL